MYKRQWFGRTRGGLAVAAVVLCAILGAMVGTVGAAITIAGLVALPFLLECKYDSIMSCGAICAGGGLGVLIPPSMMFIIYGVVAGESIAKLLIGGIVPGLILAGLYSTYILIKCHLNPEAGPLPPQEVLKMSFLDRIKMLKTVWLPITIIMCVTGTIFFGIATPSEAAAIGAIGSLLCAAVRGELTWENLKNSSYATMKTLGIIMWIVFGAMVFVSAYALAGGIEYVKETLLSLPLGRWGVLVIIQLILFFLGMVFDVIGITVLCAPIFVPVIKALGFDPLWFGIMFNINLQVAYLSPPFGYAMFYLKAVSPTEITMTDLYKGVLPFIGLQLIGMTLFILYPRLLLWLPALVRV